MVISLDLYVVKFILCIYLFFYLLQCQWPRHGSEVLENTLLILRGRAIPPSSVGFASGHRGVLLNLSGFGGYSPIPPRHASAIVSVYLDLWTADTFFYLCFCFFVYVSLHLKGYN